MRLHKPIYVILFLALGTYLSDCKEPVTSAVYLVSFTDTVKDECGYKDPVGAIVIPQGKYSACYTDTFKTFAIVLKHGDGFVAIDRQEKVLYKVFPFDNGPDYPSDGVFRIEENEKIGFADANSGKVIIRPRFDCAYPFENGIAKVSESCNTQSGGEHSSWVSNNWVYIDKSGKVVHP